MQTEQVVVHAILFMADEGVCNVASRVCRHLIICPDRPRVVHVKCLPPQRPAQHGLCPIPTLQPYFSAPPGEVVLTQGLNGELLRFPLHVFYNGTALSAGSPVNRAIHHITSGAAAKPWSGNVIAFKFNGSRRQGYTDAGVNDLPALSAYFLSFH